MPRTDKSDLDEQLIRKLASLLDETGLAEIEYEKGGVKVRVARPIFALDGNPRGKPSIPQTSNTKETKNYLNSDNTSKDLKPGTIKAPMVGVAYLSADPESEPFVKIGDKVSRDQTVLLIEAMKVFNQIKAPKAGIVSQILVDSGSPVEFGEPLLVIS